MSEVSQKQLERKHKNTNKKSSKVSGDKMLVKKMTPKEVKELIRLSAYLGGTPQDLIKELETLIPQMKADNDDDNVRKRVGEVVHKVLLVCGLDTHYPLSEIVEKEYRPQIIEFSRQLIQDYGCETSGEKALAEVIVNAYARTLRYSRLLTAATFTSVCRGDAGLYSALGKEIDRANRHFITALMTLKQFKAPSLEINVNTKTAFVAQNQQINATQNIRSKENEIIDSK